VIWLNGGERREYEVKVMMAASRVQAANDQIAAEFGSGVQLTVDNAAVYLTGRVKNLFAARRAESIAETLGKVVDLLKVDVPEQEPQILLKVRFADVDRSKSAELGISFVGNPAGIPISARTGQFPASTISSVKGSAAEFSLSDALNLFLLDPHLNMSATIKDLQSRSVLQLLAEPNVLAMNDKEASFVAGGEFPFPMLQGGGSGLGQVTIQFREFGVRIHFLPHITPRGTIRLHVTPEVSSLDYANSLSVSGFTVPALATRKVDTEIELENGQSFAIAGLLDNRTTEALSRIPGLADIPVLGKLFTSRSVTKSNSELLIIVTPQLVAPIPEGQSLPDLPRPYPFLEGAGILNQAPQTPGPDQTGPAPGKPVRRDLPVQELEMLERHQQNEPAAGAGAPPPSSPPQAAGDSGAPALNTASPLRTGK
jgi:pilus assembly protein CpaC